MGIFRKKKPVEVTLGPEVFKGLVEVMSDFDGAKTHRQVAFGGKNSKQRLEIDSGIEFQENLKFFQGQWSYGFLAPEQENSLESDSVKLYLVDKHDYSIYPVGYLRSNELPRISQKVLDLLATSGMLVPILCKVEQDSLDLNMLKVSAWAKTESVDFRSSNSSGNQYTKPSYSGSSFAQSAGKGIVFNYQSEHDGIVHDAPFAVIDLETNGLDRMNHRIIEIAIRRITANGELIDEISTLINPQVSDVGPTFIHHISREDLEGAPTFSEFAPHLLELLSGSIAVAHHAAFEDGFLGAELGRLGIPVAGVPCLDTLLLSRKVIDLPNYKLKTVVDAFGIRQEDPHTALGDVRTLSKLLPLILIKSPPILFKIPLLDFSHSSSRPTLKTRITNLKRGEEGWLSNIVRKLPENSLEYSNETLAAYSDALSQFLADGKITGDEARELAILASESGLGAQQVRGIHEAYLNEIEIRAMEDGVLSTTEKAELERIRKQFGL